MIKRSRKEMGLAVLLWPSTRAFAYLDRLKAFPGMIEEIIILNNGFSVGPDLVDEWRRWGYDRFFRLGRNLVKVAEQVSGKSPMIVESKDINDPVLVETVRSLRSEYILYTGGGIVRGEMLSLGKVLVHIHPGVTPIYKGSTCFYYSLLEERMVGATAFIMDDGIDTGRVIAQKKFKVNFFIESGQKGFMDHVLDNYLRAQMLPDVVKAVKLRSKGVAPSHPVDYPHYYVAHPIVRDLATKLMNSLFSRGVPEGLHLISED